MTEKELMQYNALKRLIEKREADIEELEAREIPIVAGKVKASMKDFPYIETRVGVQMEEPREADAVIKKIQIYKKEIADTEGKIARIEEFISGISDPELKLIFELRCYKCMNWLDIVGEMGILNNKGEILLERNRTTYIRKFKKYLQKCTKCTKCTHCTN